MRTAHDTVLDRVMRICSYPGRGGDPTVDIEAGELACFSVRVDSCLPGIVRDGAEDDSLSACIGVDRRNFVAGDWLGRLHLRNSNAVVTEPHVVVEGNVQHTKGP